MSLFDKIDQGDVVVNKSNAIFVISILSIVANANMRYSTCKNSQILSCIQDDE